jgi:hypothetical protein
VSKKLSAPWICRSVGKITRRAGRSSRRGISAFAAATGHCPQCHRTQCQEIRGFCRDCFRGRPNHRPARLVLSLPYRADYRTDRRQRLCVAWRSPRWKLCEAGSVLFELGSRCCSPASRTRAGRVLFMGARGRFAFGRSPGSLADWPRLRDRWRAPAPRKTPPLPLPQ